MQKTTDQPRRAKVILLNRDGEVAMERIYLAELCLPTIAVRPWVRPAEEVTDRLRLDHGLRAIYLWTLDSSSAEAGEIHVAEVMEPLSLPSSWEWIEPVLLEQNSKRSLELSDIATAVQVATSRSPAYPYARLGWFNELVEWAAASVNGRGLRLTGEYRQLNGGRGFLAELDTNCAPIWFKAPGDSSAIEWSLTQCLSQETPEWLPALICSHHEWRGWLAVGTGASLYTSTNVGDFLHAATSLAGLQVHLKGRTDWLLGLGAVDQRLLQLRSKISAFLDMASGLMEIQPKQPPNRLSAADLRLLGDSLERAVRSIERLGFPDSILHGDITPGSILADGERCVFIDWSRVYVGFPPICCELMLNKFAPMLGDHPDWRPTLWSSYLSAWPEFENAFESLDPILSLSLVALLAYWLGKCRIDEWESYLAHPGAPYFRSLARRMFSVALQLNMTSCVGGKYAN